MHGALPMAWKCYEGFLKDLDMVLDNHGLDKKKILSWVSDVCATEATKIFHNAMYDILQIF